jgi:hypothetical protein
MQKSREIFSFFSGILEPVRKPERRQNKGTNGPVLPVFSKSSETQAGIYLTITGEGLGQETG